MGLLTKIFGTRSQREIKRIKPLQEQVLALEEEYRNLSEEALKAKTAEFKTRYQNGETLDDLLPEAFAAIREVPTGCWACAPIPCRSWAASCCTRAASLR